MKPEQTSPLVEAAAWRARLTEQDADHTSAFEAWLAADPAHAAAWKRVQEPWKSVGAHASAPEMVELRRSALAHAHQASRSRRSFAKKLALAAGVFALVAGTAVLWQMMQPDVYTTRTGERRVVTLADGSQIALDSQSEVRVRYSRNTRDLTLSSGQARFKVAHDVQRPFSVTADGHKVVATGTAFNVDLFGPNVLVTLIEGRVIVLAPDNIPLDAGQQLVLSEVAPPSISRINIERAMAWENGEVIFENDPLSTVVARMNRYARQRLVIEDDRTSQLRISGVFHTGDVDGFVSTIVSYLPVRAEKAMDGSTRLSHL